jgi:hypothetical protein
VRRQAIAVLKLRLSLLPRPCNLFCWETTAWRGHSNRADRLGSLLAGIACRRFLDRHAGRSETATLNSRSTHNWPEAGRHPGSAQPMAFARAERAEIATLQLRRSTSVDRKSSNVVGDQQ